MLAVVTVTAQQFDTFLPRFGGELWELVDTLAPPAQGGPVNGVVFTEANGYLYVSDGGNATVVVYDFDRNVIDLPDADWALGQSDVTSSPVSGWVPNQLTTATVQVVGEAEEQTAILVSDLSEGAHRVLAFTTDGAHLFTLGLDPSGIDTAPGFINGVAMGPGAKFILTRNGDGELVGVQLIGSFAAAWSREARTVGGTMAFYGTVDAPFDFLYDAGDERFEGSPSAVLTADEPVVDVPEAVPAIEPFGLTFDTLGNLYMTDSVTERLTAYSPGPTFTRLFTFGTPDPEDGGLTTLEFFQSYGIRFWPDEVGQEGLGGGRLFIADAINNRVVAYRPNLAGKTLDSIFELDGIGALDGFPYGLAIDPASGRMAVGDDFGQQVWILKTPDLAAFNVRVFDEGAPPVEVEVVCVGAPYTVRFSLTVPAGRSPVTGVVPELTVGGSTWTDSSPIPSQTYPDGPLRPGDVMTFSYSLTAPATAGQVEFVAGVDVTTVSTQDILTRLVQLQVSSCQGSAPVMTATPSWPPQLSGWTPVRPDQLFSVDLMAVDATGVNRIDYQIEGSNHTIDLDPITYDDEDLGPRLVTVPLVQMGDTTVEFRAWNNNYVRSDWDAINVHLVDVSDLTSEEGDVVSPFSIGPSGPVSGVAFSATGLPGLPGELSIDRRTGVISGTLSYGSAGDYTVTVTESKGNQSTSVTFLWKVYNVNLAPQAVNDSYTIAEDTLLTVPASTGLLNNDDDEDDATLTARLVSGPSSGQLVLNADGSFAYTPELNVNGDITFTYVAYDGIAQSATEATVTLQVTAVNDAPSFTKGLDQTVTEDAGAQSVAGWATGISAGPGESLQQQTVSFLLSNDNSGLFTATGQPTVSPAGTLSYTSAPNAFGTATVTVRIKDDGGVANGGVDTSAPQTFVITVNSVNDGPVAAGNAYSVVEATTLSVAAPGVLAGDTDVDNAVLTAVLVAGPSHGTLALNPDGSFTYTPTTGYTGGDSFTYRASDGSAQSDAVTVSITVNPSNAPPVCTAVATPSIIWPPNHKPVYLTLSGISDPDGDTFVVRFISIWQDEPTNSSGQGNTIQDAGIEVGGAKAWVRPERTGDGDGRVYLINYTASDAYASCDGQVTVSVPHDQSGAPAVLSPGRWNSLTGQLESAPPPPVAVNDTATVTKGGSTIIDVQANDVANGSPLTVAILSKPAKGTATVNANGTITYKALKSTGTATFTYRITDIYGGTATATVTITVTS